MKLYTQQKGNMESQCAKMLYGDQDGSLAQDAHVDQFFIHSNPLK